MRKSCVGLMFLALVAVFVLALGGVAFAQAGVDLGPGMSTANSATGGGLEAAAIGEMGNTEFDEASAMPILDLPALNVDQDKHGRIRMDLPGLKLFGPGKKAAPPPGPGLPVTGVNVGDLFALGLAALSGGGVLLRRLRLSLAS